jgi:hypothetical protein
MRKDLYLLSYNNYYNRLLKKEDSLADYLENNYRVFTDINFNPRDGVTTEQVINFPIGSSEFNADYLIVAQNGNIVSRWFIMENYWNRENQLTLILKRDLLVDFYDDYADQPFFCERGAVSVTGGVPGDEFIDPDPDFTIFNKEGIEVSRTLKYRTLIRDITNTPWILLYIAKDAWKTFTNQEEPPYRPAPNNPIVRFYPADRSREEILHSMVFDVNYPDETAANVSNILQSTRDTPYDIWAIPLFGKFYYQTEAAGEEKVFVLDKKKAIRLAYSLIEGFGDALYDAQLVPFFPDVSLYDFTTHKDGFKAPFWYNYLNYQMVRYVSTRPGETGVEPVDYYPLFHCKNSSCSSEYNAPVDFNLAVQPSYLEYEASLGIDWKVENITSSCRIVAPNKSAIFEFTVPEIGGCGFLPVDGSPRGEEPAVKLLINCTFKPYQSYISIHPLYSELSLYGDGAITYSPPDQDVEIGMGDPRGCIFQGDMSLPQTSDAWREYMIQNKNLNNTFNRDIESLEFQQSMSRIDNLFGVLGGIGSGAAAGAIAGGPAGAIAGGAVSAIGGIADLFLNEQQYKENLDYAKDKFNYNVDNIRSISKTLSNISSFDIDNTIYPTFEYYHASAIETEMVRNKIKYDGMTVGRVYPGFSTAVAKATADCPYIRGKLIRSLSIKEDYHLLNELGLELSKGVYVL